MYPLSDISKKVQVTSNIVLPHGVFSATRKLTTQHWVLAALVVTLPLSLPRIGACKSPSLGMAKPLPLRAPSWEPLAAVALPLPLVKVGAFQPPSLGVTRELGYYPEHLL